jgi:hypothetical protein
MTSTINGREQRNEIGADKVRGLVRVVERERFFELHESYGTAVVEGDYRVLFVALRGKKSRVALYSKLSADPRREEVGRALRVCIAVSSLVGETEAADSCREDGKLLGVH